MKILLLAGEESGVLYANEIKKRLVGNEFRGYGDYGFATHDLAVMGIFAVLRRIFFFLRVKRTMERAITDWRPDLVLTVDYPGLNLKLAAFAKKLGIRTVHVVCPQVWAWKAGRIPMIERSLDRLCCFFPFEPKLFRPGLATFVGHPLAMAITALPARVRSASSTVALLPGSRKGEIERILPILLRSAAILHRRFPTIRFVVPAAGERARRQIESVLARASLADTLVGAIEVRQGGARELLVGEADVAVVASGTATLESALARCPTVLVYKASPALYLFAKAVLKGVKHIGLANILWEKSEHADGPFPMPELLQGDFTPEAVAELLGGWLGDESLRQEAIRRLEAATALLSTSADSDPISNIVSEL